MLMLDADQVLNMLPYPAMAEELTQMHRDDVGLVDEMLMESKDDSGNVNHFWVRGGWQPEKAVGAKVISIFPRNNRAAEWPSIQAVYILFEGQNGTPIACLDGTALTYIKTAADSALGSRLLSRPDAEQMLMIGAGKMAPHLVRAHCQLRPSIERVEVWNRSADKAAHLCAELADEFAGIEFSAITDLETGVRNADLVCSAIASSQPVLEGAWLKPGAHVDLIGSYTAEMREADDEVMRRGRLFVDARATTMEKTGELAIPLASGVIQTGDVLAELSELCRGEHPGRESDDEITIFKNGGGGHLDLMCARILHAHCQH